jgi:hypothetical protein
MVSRQQTPDPDAKKGAMPAIFVVGFSHLGAIVRAQQVRIAAKQKTFELHSINFNLVEAYKPFFVEDKGAIIYNEAMLQDVRRCIVEKKPSLIVESLWSNQHFVLSTFNDPRPFDFVLPSETERPLCNGAELIPYDLMHEFLTERCRSAGGLGPLIRDFASVPTYTISAPPPIEDLSIISGGSPNEAISAKVDQLGLAPAELRYKIWKLCETIFSNHSVASGIPFVPVPDATVGGNGFRKQDYYSTDWIHASDSYGELVLRQIDELVIKGTPHDRSSI